MAQLLPQTFWQFTSNEMLASNVKPKAQLVESALLMQPIAVAFNLVLGVVEIGEVGIPFRVALERRFLAFSRQLEESVSLCVSIDRRHDRSRPIALFRTHEGSAGHPRFRPASRHRAQTNASNVFCVRSLVQPC